MSYTPHEWQNDELITAAKLNNIEEGIAEGGGGGANYSGYVSAIVTSQNYPSSEMNLAAVVNVYKVDGANYDFIEPPFSGAGSILVFGNETYLRVCTVINLDGYKNFFICASGTTLISSSGGIATEPTLINNQNAYEVTGDFAVTLRGWT